jgi:hypothetical protein
MCNNSTDVLFIFMCFMICFIVLDHVHVSLINYFDGHYGRYI